MYYGIYKNVRNAAWQCLIDFKVDSLPVDVIRIAKEAGIKVIENKDINVLGPYENGKVFYMKRQWFIVYDERVPMERLRRTIAHELGHVFLGHRVAHKKYPNVSKAERVEKGEEQATAFAVRLLCPACVLKDLNVQSADDIIKYCMVDRGTAEDRMSRMKKLYKRNKFLTDPLEKQVYDNFSQYIQDELFKKENAKGIEDGNGEA